MSFKKFNSLPACPLAGLFVLFKCKKLINYFKKLFVFLINNVYSDIELFLPCKLGFHFKSFYLQYIYS